MGPTREDRYLMMGTIDLDFVVHDGRLPVTRSAECRFSAPDKLPAHVVTFMVAKD